jgi:uncharacterized membrane protein HdeD (DUF308 family)
MNDLHTTETHRPPFGGALRQEFRHLRENWWWFLLLGILLAVCGTAALVFPTMTVVTSFAAVVVLGVALMVAGLATIVAALWAGKWSGLLVQLLVGILYVVAGFGLADSPGRSAAILTLFLASLFIVAGTFRAVAALMMRFPHWGWTLLNGLITLLCGVIIYRHFPDAALWVIGVLVGVDMLFQGWTWIMLAIAVRNIPKEVA